MGFFKNKNNYNFDDIKYAYESINIPRYEDIEYLPLGENKNRAIECKIANPNILHVTIDENDLDMVTATILQIIKKEESLIVLDPDGKLYHKFKTLLFSKNYKTRYINIDDEESNTWSFFSGDEIDINNPNAVEDVLKKSRLLLEIFADEFLEKEDKEEYLEIWSVIFGAFYAYIYTNNLLNENKFDKMYELLEYHTVYELDKIFEEANDITYELWFNTIDIDYEEKDYLITLTLGLLDIIREPSTNRLISTSDLTLTSPAKRKSAFFFDSIPDALDDNNCINIILNFMLAELKDCLDEKNLFDIPINFILNNIDFFPNLSHFIEYAATFKNNNISFIYTCSELDSIYETYSTATLNTFFNSLNYLTLTRYDKENLEVINKHMIELPEDITEDTLYRKEILVAQDRVILCRRFDLTQHPMYYRICYE